MEIIDYSIEWARGEVFSSKVITLISVFVLLCAAGFYFWGKTAMARAYWMPLAVSGVFLIVVAGGLYFANHPRITNFQEQYKENAGLFVKSELERTAKSDRNLNNIVYMILPILVIVFAIGAIVLTGVNWRAWLITMMLLCSFLMIVDGNTKARNAAYRTHLESALKP